MAENPGAEVFREMGAAGFERLSAAFYKRVKGDALLGPMYPAEDMEGARERLRDFLIFRFGGPATYIEKRGHPRLRMRHAPFRVDAAARDRWVELMEGAMAEIGAPPAAAGRLLEFFRTTATFLVNHEGEEGTGAGFAGNPLFPVAE